MKPRKRTVSIEARLDEVARMKAQIPTYRELEAETGLAESYLREIISEKIRAIVEQTHQCMDSNMADSVAR